VWSFVVLFLSCVVCLYVRLAVLGVPKGALRTHSAYSRLPYGVA